MVEIISHKVAAKISLNSAVVWVVRLGARGRTMVEVLCHYVGMGDLFEFSRRLSGSSGR